jgi:hypothetical protein
VLIPSPRHSRADLEAWARVSRADAAIGKTRAMAAKVEAASHAAWLQQQAAAATPPFNAQMAGAAAASAYYAPPPLPQPLGPASAGLPGMYQQQPSAGLQPQLMAALNACQHAAASSLTCG